MKDVFRLPRGLGLRGVSINTGVENNTSNWFIYVKFCLPIYYNPKRNPLLSQWPLWELTLNKGVGFYYNRFVTDKGWA